jgi:hypothetical protein
MQRTLNISWKSDGSLHDHVLSQLAVPYVIPAATSPPILRVNRGTVGSTVIQRRTNVVEIIDKTETPYTPLERECLG